MTQAMLQSDQDAVRRACVGGEDDELR